MLKRNGKADQAQELLDRFGYKRSKSPHESGGTLYEMTPRTIERRSKWDSSGDSFWRLPAAMIQLLPNHASIPSLVELRAAIAAQIQRETATDVKSTYQWILSLSNDELACAWTAAHQPDPELGLPGFRSTEVE